MGGDVFRRLIEKAGDRFQVVGAGLVGLGRHRIDKRHLDRAGTDMGIDDSTSVAITALLAEEGDDIGFIEYANGFQRQQFRIAGARADAGQAAFGIRLQSPALATALTARSEEHTSELQSLMRISYAVFCLKKKKKVHT